MDFHNRLASFNLDAELTPAELRVARLVACGLTNHAIACSTYRSEDTIKSQVKTLLRKTGAVSRYALVVWLYEAGRLHRGMPTFACSPQRPVAPQLSAEHSAERVRLLRVINATRAQLDSALTDLGSL